jgi:hypothetical protein
MGFYIEDQIQEINGHLIAISPAGQWAVINNDVKIVSTQVREKETVRVAEAQPQGRISS